MSNKKYYTDESHFLDKVFIKNPDGLYNPVNVNYLNSLGIGLYSLEYILDLNDINKNIYLYAGSGAINKPTTSNGFIYSEFLNINNGRQIYNNLDGSRIFYRSKISGTWGVWKDITPNASGTTANRPSTVVNAGLLYFDTTLGKPIWYNGTNWVDATGTIV